MRPTDENQPGAKRPNLMGSSRRAAGNIHILARLDSVGRARPKRILLWSGIAGGLTCALAGAALWVARTPDPATDATAVATVVPADAAPPHAEAPPHVETLAPPAIGSLAPPTAVPAVPGGATIVNVPDTIVAPAIASAPAPVPRPFVTPTQHSKAAAGGQPPKWAAYRPAPHPAGAGVHGAPVPRRPPPAKSAPVAAPDTDVALISAIIQHAAAKHDGADEPACGAKPCAERPPGPR